MPGARRTRSLVCAWGSEYAHEYSQRVRRDHPASPRNCFTAYTALSPEIGLCCLRRLRRLLRKLDASVEASGPHVFAVRVGTVRYRHLSVHRIPPRVRDDREPPLMWDGTALISEVIWVWREEAIFLQRGLDRNSVICPSGLKSRLLPLTSRSHPNCNPATATPLCYVRRDRASRCGSRGRSP